jgi:hypothetical protein
MISKSLFIYETYLHLLKQTETLPVSLKMTFNNDRNDMWSSSVSKIFILSSLKIILLLFRMINKPNLIIFLKNKGMMES